MTLTIISGAAPGVEQGAIEAAVNLALHWQGWASIAHFAALPPIYRSGLYETSATDPGMVRRLNCQDSDGALVFSTSMVLVGVPAFVDRCTERMGRAFLHVTLNPATFGGATWTAVDGSKVDRRVVGDEVIERVRAWLRDLPSGRVYVTGPSAEDVPGIQGAVRDALIAILEPFAVEEVRQTTRAVTLLRELAEPLADHPAMSAAIDAEVARRLGPATSADLLDLDAVPDPVDSAAPLHVHQTPPEGLDEVQRAQLDASIREAERDIRDEPPTPGD